MILGLVYSYHGTLCDVNDKCLVFCSSNVEMFGGESGSVDIGDILWLLLVQEICINWILGKFICFKQR